MTKRENYLRAVRFERPDYIPVWFLINQACWEAYDQDALCELVERHPLLFPGFQAPPRPFKPEYAPLVDASAPYTDDFGCVWQTRTSGMIGSVIRHPLDDWSKFPQYRFPDPDKSSGLGPVDWEQVEGYIRGCRNNGEVAQGGLRHGHTFLQLCDLRGYENLMFDFADEEPLLWELIDRLEQFNLGIVRHYMKMDLDVMGYPEDLGMQVGPMLSPAHFRKYIKPSYERLIKPARDAGVLIHMHSDGDLHTLLDDIVGSGVDIINLQDQVNGVDWIAEKFRGHTCVDLDIDRQDITVHGTPRDIDEMIAHEVKTIGTREGGLLLVFGMYPGIPLENAAALMDSLERYMGYYD